MSSGRAISFAISVISLAVLTALSAPTGPDSPRAKGARWLRAHGYPEIAIVVEPSTVPDVPGIGGAPALPPLP
jgi:hypothetical protein